MIKKYFLCISLLFSFIFSVNILSQQKTNEEILQGFDDYVNKVMADWKVQGCAVAIIKNGQIILTKGYGLRDVKNNLPVTESTQFAIGSCSKAFTAAAVCILVDRDKIDLDKPVINYIPSFKMYDDYVTMNMTPRDLMCHRSGLPRYDLVWYGADLTRNELFEKLRYLEPTKPFRTTFQYQNGMFMAAGVLVERVSGETWENFVKENIFTPLDMKYSNFSITDMQKSPDFSKPYRESDDGIKEIPFRNIDAMGPAGSINSNVNEMAHWVIMQLNNGSYHDKQVVSEVSMNEMHTPQMVAPGGMNKDVFYHSYGLAWDITSYRGHLRVEHGGNIDGFSADVALYPMDSLGVVVLTNMESTQMPNIVRNNAVDRYLNLDFIDWSARLIEGKNNAEKMQKENTGKEDEGRVKDTNPSHSLESYAGFYENPAFGKIEFTCNNDKLSFNYHTFKSELKHYHYDTFSAQGEIFDDLKVTFYTNEKGEIYKVSSKLEPSSKDIEFVKVTDTKNIDLGIYTGAYEMDQMTATVTLKGDNILNLTVPGQPTYELVPSKENEFDIKGLSGFSVSFNLNGNKTGEIVFHQPNGTFTAKRK